MPPRSEVYAMEIPPSRFPHFHDGDVKIIITGSRQYQLHSTILKGASSLFRKLLSEENTATLSSKAKKKGVVITNVLRASIHRDDEDGSLDIKLKSVKLDGDGRVIAPQSIPLDLENGLSVPPELTAYDKVLRATYNQPINLSDFGGQALDDILPDALEVVKVADYFGCAGIITSHFEATLLALGQSVYLAIAKDPAQWIDLAMKVQSRTLYRESMIHAAGQFNTQDMRDAYPTFDELTRHHLKIMSDQLHKLVKKRVSLMLSYYPIQLQRIKKTSLMDKEENSRNSYANDILHWMALSIFRQWLAHQIADDNTHHAKDMGYGFMKAVKAGGEHYLGETEIQHWHQFFPMSARAANVVEMKLDEIKKHVKQWTRGLFINESKLDMKQHDTGYFTCSRFCGISCPWEAPETQQDPDDDDSDASGEESDGQSEL